MRVRDWAVGHRLDRSARNHERSACILRDLRGDWFSAALCRGLIEACSSRRRSSIARPGFPRLYAAASLKPRVEEQAAHVPPGFSAALCRGLIEAQQAQRSDPGGLTRFSAALCRGLIEALMARPLSHHQHQGFPRLYAAASLKRVARLACQAALGPVFRGFMPRPH